MTPQEKTQLMGVISATSLYYGQQIPDAALKLFVEDLEDLPLGQVIEAIKACRRDPKTTRCPLPATIRARIQPQADADDLANAAVSEIVHAISRVGPYATPMLSELAKEVVRAEGGWMQVCELLTNDNLTFMRAQWRDLARARIASGRPLGLERPALPDQSRRGGELSQFDSSKLLVQPEPEDSA